MKPYQTVVAAVAAAALLATAGCGSSSNDADSTPSGTKTISVTMTDTAYTPTAVGVKVGQKVTFRFTNNGKVAHDTFIGDAMAQADHEKEMASDMGGMHHGGGGEEAITVDPGKTGTLTRAFATVGTTLVGCHQPGHYTAGMKMTVNAR